MHKIMGRFYQFKRMFHIAWNILSFPVLFFYLHNLKKGWWKWYRTWANNVTRFEGWLLMRRWFAEFKKDNFSGKLAEAKKILRQPVPVAEKTWFAKSSRTSI